MRLDKNTGIAFFIIALDQLSKFITPTNQIIKNPGLPFGISFPGTSGFFVALLTLGILVLFIFFGKKYFLPGVGFFLVVSGAVSNLVDRFAFGYVRDIFHLGQGSINLADLAIWSGIVLIIYKSQGTRGQESIC